MPAHKEYTFINLQNVEAISRGDQQQVLKYLKQFNALIPERLYYLKKALLIQDRKEIRQILHKMSPQLQFFGVPNITTPIRRMEFEYDTLPLVELEAIVEDIIVKLEGAIKEVSNQINQF
ncbi:hypothetical protein ACFO5O_08615 [Geojedonia litorea]|uniref:HPt domain-containing protein n=1 Tax=Geojedonia litorea TaxID=1268269 RepID=A0ABV9N2D3_9FLAO